MTRAAIALFVVVAALGPMYTARGYSPTTNVISELAAQNTPGNHFMATAFVFLGAALLYDSLKEFHLSLLPFMLFGAAFGAAGVFGHKPISEGVPYSVAFDTVHSILATASGVALTIGFVWQAIAASSSIQKGIAAALALACTTLPMLMLSFPQGQGLVQRVLYLLVFTWLWAHYPQNVHASHRA